MTILCERRKLSQEELEALKPVFNEWRRRERENDLLMVEQIQHEEDIKEEELKEVDQKKENCRIENLEHSAALRCWPFQVKRLANLLEKTPSEGFRELKLIQIKQKEKELTTVREQLADLQSKLHQLRKKKENLYNIYKTQMQTRQCRQKPYDR